MNAKCSPLIKFSPAHFSRTTPGFPSSHFLDEVPEGGSPAAAMGKFSAIFPITSILFKEAKDETTRAVSTAAVKEVTLVLHPELRPLRPPGDKSSFKREKGAEDVQS
ncbi:hypothetical protein Q5P01_018100 [Channa striata]|uniref:Uncharacterized protein n=1 Tax=Channa striata TaxID=64152 RepID=A0AA88SFJ4_CHASR|nr:hypothetical protein Q5P01_018100 [Channa striata]